MAWSRGLSHLRALDTPSVTMIKVMPVPHQGLGEAINDRLRRGHGTAKVNHWPGVDASLSRSGSRCFHHFASPEVPCPRVSADAGIW
jgi:hypothetical protein